MARIAEWEPKHLASRTPRKKLKPRRKGYFTQVRRGLTLGYIRRDGRDGSWVVRQEVGRDEAGPKYKTCTIGAADDYSEPDGKNVLAYDHALRLAGSGALVDILDGPLTVGQAIDQYLSHLQAHNSERAAADARSKLEKHVTPTLGAVRVSALTLKELQAWQQGLIHHDDDDPDVERRSKDIANRILASFKAALNKAFQEESNGIATDAAWRRLKAFKDVGGTREDHFSEAEVAALIKAARQDDEPFANLLEAAFHSGGRLGELVMLDVKHFDAKRNHLRIPGGKTGSRDTTLTSQAVAFFERMAKGKSPSDVLLPRVDGERWAPDQQRPRLARALQAAGLPTSACFYTLRQLHISRAIERGIPLRLIATNVGTSVRMIEQTYSKFIAQTRRDLIEKYAPVLPA